MVFICNASNFVTYFTKSMHYPPAKSANMVTNFMGTSFLLTILGGFISDSLFTRFTTFILSCIIELLVYMFIFQSMSLSSLILNLQPLDSNYTQGLILLTIQSHNTRLRPALNLQPSQSQAAFLYTGIYAVAAGAAGINANLPAHGADQLDHSNQRQISAFFNWFFFSLCTGGLISATVMVWVEENKGWNWSFPITVIVLCLALFIFISGSPFYRHKRPTGSALTRIIKVCKCS